MFLIISGVRGQYSGVRVLISDFIIKIVTSYLDFKVIGSRLLVTGRFQIIN
jgi:hypothetical protein